MLAVTASVVGEPAVTRSRSSSGRIRPDVGGSWIVDSGSSSPVCLSNSRADLKMADDADGRVGELKLEGGRNGVDETKQENGVYEY